MNKLYLWGGVALALILAGFLGAYYMFRPDPPKPETYAEEVVQLDGSKVLERKPQPNAKPVHMVPRGSKVERIIHLKVASPSPVAIDMGAGVAPSFECPTVEVDMTIIENKDKSHSVIASANGQILRGVDIPVALTDGYKEPKWMLGLGKNLLDEGWMVRGSRRVIGPVFGGVMYLNHGEKYEVFGTVDLIF